MRAPLFITEVYYSCHQEGTKPVWYKTTTSTFKSSNKLYPTHWQKRKIFSHPLAGIVSAINLTEHKYLYTSGSLCNVQYWTLENIFFLLLALKLCLSIVKLCITRTMDQKFNKKCKMFFILYIDDVSTFQWLQISDWYQTQICLSFDTKFVILHVLLNVT